MTRPRATPFVDLAAEAMRCVRSQAVGTVLSSLMVAAMCAGLLLTLGRGEGSRLAVLANIEDAGPRTILIRADVDAGITTSALARIASLNDVEAVCSFGPARDVTNAGVSGSARVSLRPTYSSCGGGKVKIGGVVATQRAAGVLGLVDGIGEVRDDAGIDYTVRGVATLSRSITFLEPAVFEPRSATDGAPITLMAVTVRDARQVSTSVDVLSQLLGASDPSRVQIQTNKALAEVQQSVSARLAKTTTGLVIGMSVLTGLLLAAITYGLVMMRRKDFGRRRALGASRGLIVSLVLSQTAITSILGVLIGDAIGLGALAALDDPLPGGEFVAAANVQACCVALIATLLPAVAASRRDPLTELRVP